MVTLASINGASLVPDISQGLQAISEAFGTPESRQDRRLKISQEDAAAQRSQEIDRLIGEIGDPRGKKNPNQAALLRLNALDPTIGKAVLDVIKSGDAQAREAFRLEAERGAKQAIFVSSQTDFAAKQRAIRSLATQAAAQGKPLDRFIELQNLSEPQLDLELQRMKIAGQDLKTILKPVEKFAPVLNDQGDIVGQQNVTTGRVVADPRASPSGTPGLASAVTKVFPSGEVIQALPNGDVQVRDASGAIVEGAQRLETLRSARQKELDFSRQASGQKAAGSAAIKRSESAIDRIGKIKTSIANINKAVELLDQGAGTGPIMSRLPSIRSASVALDNVQKAMGLDVIGTTTFGALSKGELDLALSKALPTGLNPDALKEWLIEKKASQEKLSSYLENAAIFLGIPGNTSADWVAAQKELRRETQSAKPANEMTDAELLKALK